jgi:hypothetical protein
MVTVTVFPRETWFRARMLEIETEAGVCTVHVVGEKLKLLAIGKEPSRPEAVESIRMAPTSAAEETRTVCRRTLVSPTKSGLSSLSAVTK